MFFAVRSPRWSAEENGLFVLVVKSSELQLPSAAMGTYVATKDLAATEEQEGEEEEAALEYNMLDNAEMEAPLPPLSEAETDARVVQLTGHLINIGVEVGETVARGTLREAGGIVDAAATLILERAEAVRTSASVPPPPPPPGGPPPPPPLPELSRDDAMDVEDAQISAAQQVAKDEQLAQQMTAEDDDAAFARILDEDEEEAAAEARDREEQQQAGAGTERPRRRQDEPLDAADRAKLGEERSAVVKSWPELEDNGTIHTPGESIESVKFSPDGTLLVGSARRRGAH